MLSDATMRRKYGITRADYDRMLIECSGRCTICLKVDDDTLVIDHCHDTGVVRGLLCHECNSGIGLLGDNRKAVYKAYKYLLAFEKEHGCSKSSNSSTDNDSTVTSNTI